MCSTRHKGNEEGKESGGCGCGGQGGRKFFTKEERLDRLQKYREDLEKEIVAVKEAIHELKG
jgi:hypothetical protein